jgi:hypothetical protein
MLGNWYPTKDGDARAYALFKRHYSALPYQLRKRRNGALFVGPGRKIVLLTADCRALFVWRKFIDKSGQQGVNCAVFRNEGEILSSSLILEAEQLAWHIWPEARLYTYVNARKIKSSNPGYCFLVAGWRKCGITKTRKLIILEKLPTKENPMPEYDPTNPPKPATADLRPDTPLGEPKFSTWPANELVPERYAGPTPDREFETNSRTVHVAAPVAAVAAPTESHMESVSPPPP